MPDFDDLRAIEVMHRYYRWKFDLVRPWIGNRVVEVGCGTGLFLEHLAGRALALGVDCDPACVAEGRARLAGRPGLEIRHLDVLDAGFSGLAALAPDTVVFMSSLEEIATDATALSRAAAILAPGGRLVVFASALPGLAGELDRAFHQRRYTRAGIGALLAAAGCRVERTRYANLLGALGWLWDSRFQRRTVMTADLYRKRDLAVPWARLLDAVTGPPVGRSVIAVGVKN